MTNDVWFSLARNESAPKTTRLEALKNLMAAGDLRVDHPDLLKIKAALLEEAQLEHELPEESAAAAAAAAAAAEAAPAGEGETATPTQATVEAEEVSPVIESNPLKAAITTELL